MSVPILPPIGYIFGPEQDLLLGLAAPLAERVPNLQVKTAIPDEDNFELPFLMVRANVDASTVDAYGDRDNRFDRRFVADVQTWCREAMADGEPSGDDRNKALQELVFHQLQTAWLKQVGVPGVGFINRFAVATPAHRVADWATATGVNQYANLARNMTRFQAEYHVVMRPDRRRRTTQDDLFAILGG